MFVPLRDENPLRAIRWQFVTIGLILVNTIIFFLQLTQPGQAVAASFATIPSEILGVRVFGGPARGPYDLWAVPEAFTLISYMFLHGSPLHLGGNMLFLWVFGDNIEDAMGHLKFFVFYILCGIAGGFAHVIMTPSSGIPLIGASGAVAGVIAAYLILHPRVRVWVLAFKFIPLKISAAWVLGAWVITQFVMLLVPNSGPVAWWAHIGGLAAGALLVVFMRNRGVRLFDQPPPVV